MIKIVVFAIAMAWVFVNVVNKRKWLNFKPFTCDFCMSGWFAALLYGLFLFCSSWVIDLLGLICVAMVSFVLLNGVINKL